jgi:hypothetical protein
VVLLTAAKPKSGAQNKYANGNCGINSSVFQTIPAPNWGFLFYPVIVTIIANFEFKRCVIPFIDECSRYDKRLLFS